MIGWGASVGGLIVAAMGLGSNKNGRLSSIVLDAIRSSHFTVIAHTGSEPESTLVREVMGESTVENGARRLSDQRH